MARFFLSIQQVQSVLSGVFSIEKASTSRENLQQAVNRIVAIIKSDPHKERLDRVITRWLKRHLQRLDAAVDLKQLNSLVEDNEMLAENLQHWAEKERMTGEQIGLQKGEKLGLQKGERLGIQKGEKLGLQKGKKEIVISLIALGSMPDEQIAKVSGFSLEEIATLRKDGSH